MTETAPPSTALETDPEYRAAVIDLLGVLAYGELTAFERLAADGKVLRGTGRGDGKPIGWQDWRELLFLHWEAKPEELAKK